MGNECASFANATPFEVKIKIHSDTMRAESGSESSEHNVNLSAKGAAKAKPIGPVPAQAELSAEAQASYGYNKKFDTQYVASYVDPNFEGFAVLGPDQRMDFQYITDFSTPYYLTVIVMFDNQRIKVVQERFRLPFKRIMLGLSQKGTFEIVEVAEGKTWRAKKSVGSQNYYGRVCNTCR